MAEIAALEAWRRATRTRGGGHVTGVLKAARKKSAVMRLAVPGYPQSVIAKRSSIERFRSEKWLYDVVLKDIEIGTPRLIASLEEADGSHGWLFLEDCGDIQFDWHDPVHRRMGTEWLARLHVATANPPSDWPLARRSGAELAAIARESRSDLLSIMAQAGLPSDCGAIARALVRGFDVLLTTWPGIAPIIDSLPPAIAHADFQSKNVRLVSRPEGLRVMAFDWEMSRVGSPVVDLEHADLDTYRAVVGGPASQYHDGLARAAGAGRLARLIMEISWATSYFRIGSLRPVEWRLDERMGAALAWVDSVNR